MTFNDSSHYRLAYAELTAQLWDAIGVRPIRMDAPPCAPSAADLVGLPAREFRVCSALLIDVLRHWFQMGRVYASSMRTAGPAWAGSGIVAEVVELQAIGDRSYEPFVEESRCLHDSAALAVPDARIATLRKCASPNPARCFVAEIASFVAALERLWRSSATSDTPVVTVDESLRLAFAVAFRGGGVQAGEFAASARAFLFGHIPIYAHASAVALVAARST